MPGCVYHPPVIYGQEVLYAARGQDARSRPAQAGIQWFNNPFPPSGNANNSNDNRTCHQINPAILHSATSLPGFQPSLE